MPAPSGQIPPPGARQVNEAMAVWGWLAKLQRDGVGASTRAKAYRLLSRISGTAIESGYLTRNPLRHPRRRRRASPRDALRHRSRGRRPADAIPPRFRALVLVAYTGLRWGELSGLRVKRVDLLHGRITLVEQFLEVRGRLAFGPPRPAPGCGR